MEDWPSAELDEDGEEKEDQQPDLGERSAAWQDESEQEEALITEVTEGFEPHGQRLPDDVVRSLRDEWSAEEDNALSEKLASFRDAVLRVPKSPCTVEAKVGLVNSHGRRRSSLSASPGCSLTAWRFDGRPVSLESTYRYMCLLDGVSKWGWARVVKGRISFVASAVDWSGPVVLAGSHYRLGFEAIWSPSDTTGNLKVTVTQFGKRFTNHSLLEVDCWFDLNTLTVLRAREGKEGEVGFETKRLKKRIEDNTEEFQSQVLALVLSPFKYKKKKLQGSRAPDFFGPVGTSYSIRLAAINRRYFLVAKRL
jgi:hypothetical protein